MHKRQKSHFSKKYTALSLWGDTNVRKLVGGKNEVAEAEHPFSKSAEFKVRLVESLTHWRLEPDASSPPSSRYAWLKAWRHSSVIGCSTPWTNIVEERSMIRSGAPFITSRYRSSFGSSVWCTDTYKGILRDKPRREPFNGGVECRWGRQKSRFWAYIWLHCVPWTVPAASAIH